MQNLHVGGIRDGEHIVGADSTLHYPAFLPPGRIFAESIQDTSGRAYVNKVAHPESLESQVIVHCDLDILLRPEIAFGRLDRGMVEEEFDLLQIPPP